MGWFKKAPKKRDPSGLDIYMHPVEFSQVLAILHAVGPRRFLEWGAGGSTRAILASCPFIDRYVAIEHNEAWWATVRDAIRDPRLDLRHVPPDLPYSLPNPSSEQIIEWEKRAESDPTVFAKYVAEVDREMEPFDAVLVDGRARSYCVARGFKALRPGGVLLIHDAQRTEYHAALHAVGSPFFLEPFHQGQVALVRKPNSEESTTSSERP